jgi:hypothetical protein
MEVRVYAHAPSALPPKKEPTVTLRLDEAQSQFKRCEDKKFLPEP